MKRRVVGPFNRVEGDLEVHLSVDEGEVREARVVSPLYRGFEQILQGKDPRDALVYVPRICGICSVSQSVAAASALADAQGLTMPPNGELAVNLILACENMADHLTHFYLFFMPDFAREAYRRESWYPAVADRFRALKGSAARAVLPARADFMHLMGLLAGKWPHTQGILPGGSSRGVEIQEQARLLAILYAFRSFLEKTLFVDSLEGVSELASTDELWNWLEKPGRRQGDMGRFLEIAAGLKLEGLGRGSDRFMSYGAYTHTGEHLFDRGVNRKGELIPLDPYGIREDISHSWMGHQNSPRHPFHGVTLPEADAENGYSWCKAPRLDGRVTEVGALSRQVVDGHPLILDLVRESGGNVQNRVIARLLELARVVPAMERWARELKPKAPFCNHAPVPDEAMGCGMVEAARGSLGHWLKVRRGRILNYQVVAPTTWNFSPRDEAGVPGPLEQALVGTPVIGDQENPVAVQHVVRSFDPCMVCTVH